MKELQVTYSIDEEQYESLLRLLEVERGMESKERKGFYPYEEQTLEELFHFIMFLGSKQKINKAIEEYCLDFKR